MDQTSGSITKVPFLVFPGPWTALPHIGMSHMDSAAILAALDVGCPAVKPPMANLVAEPTFFPEWALLVTVVSSICPALTTVPGSVLCSSSKRSRGWILISEGSRVRVSYVSVNPACRVSKWTESQCMDEVRQ